MTFLALHHILRMVLYEGPDVCCGGADEPEPGLAGGPGNVGRDEGMGLFQQRIVGFGRFFRENVGTIGCDAALGKCFGHIAIVYQRYSFIFGYLNPTSSIISSIVLS